MRTVSSIMRLLVALLGLELTNFLWGPEVATDASRSRSYTGGGFVCRDTAFIYDFMARTVRARRVNLLTFWTGRHA